MRRYVLFLMTACLVASTPAQTRPGEIVPWQAQFQAIAGDQWPWRAAQVKAESGFSLDAHSPAGAVGPAQFMPATWRWCQGQKWVRPSDRPVDLVPALTAQHHYMTWIQPRVGYSKAATNGAYNAGLGNIQAAQAHAKALGLQGENAWLRTLPAITKTHAKETQDYVQRIAGFEAEILAAMRSKR